MGEFVRHMNEEIFVPEYRVTFGFTMLSTTTRLVRVQGNVRLHIESGPDAGAINAVHQAEIMLMLDENFAAGALNVGSYVAKMERESGHVAPWEQITTAYRAVKGSEIQVITDGEPEWVIVRRWEPFGEPGIAMLIDSMGRSMGGYPKHHVFVTR